MFLHENKQTLYQWEVNQKLIVENELVKEVHFSNAVTPKALVVEVVEGMANIPNILLQADFDIKAFGYCGQSVRESYTVNVIGRAKPDDYIYTETEIKNYEDLEASIKELEKHDEEIKDDMRMFRIQVDEASHEASRLTFEVQTLHEDSTLLHEQMNKKPGLKIGVGEVFNDYNNNVAPGKFAHTEGTYTSAYGTAAHAEGYGDTTKIILAEGHGAHAEGFRTTAKGEGAHAQGRTTQALAAGAHAEGNLTQALGIGSHAEGGGTIAGSDYQHVQGKWNETDYVGKYVHIVGWGTEKAPKNIHTIDKVGNAYFDGNVECDYIILRSSTANSTKRYKLSIDDSGTLGIT